jgi:MFS family permease
MNLLVREVRSLPRLYWMLWLGTLLNRAGGFVAPFLAFYVTAQGGTEAQAGFVVAIYGAGALLAGFAGGVLADRIGRRATMLLSMFGGAAALLGMGLSPSLESLAVFTFLTGLMGEFYRPAVSAAIADVVAPELRPRAYAHLYWVINLGFAIAPTLAGLVASFDYFALFAIDAATMFAFGVVVFVWVPETRGEPAPTSESDKGKKTGIEAVLRDRVFMTFALLSFGVGLVMWQNAAPLPLHMKRLGISESSYGLVMGLNGIMIVFLQPLMNLRISSFPRTVVLSLGSLVFALGFGLYGLVSTAWGFAVGTAIWTVAEIAILPLSSAIVADLSPAALRGRYQGVYAMSWGLASCLAPLLGGALLERAGGSLLWAGCAAVMTVVALGHLLTGPRRVQRELELRSQEPPLTVA